MFIIRVRPVFLVFYIKVFNSLLGGSVEIQFLDIVGNILIALYKEIYLILRSENIVFIIKGCNLILGGSFEIQFLGIF